MGTGFDWVGSMRPSRKRSRAADDDQVGTRAGPFAPVLGGYRQCLARPLADQFFGADGAHRVRLDGTMHHIWHRHVWLRPLFSLLARFDILFPESGCDGTFAVRREALNAKGPNRSEGVSLQRYRPWFYAAAAYNLAWGLVVIVWPVSFFRLIGMPLANEIASWQALGMMVLVYAPAYWWVARDPMRHRHLVVIALLGKLLGPLGFLWALHGHTLPLLFGLTILTNDCLWWPAFTTFLIRAARGSGGWRALLAGR